MRHPALPIRPCPALRQLLALVLAVALAMAALAHRAPASADSMQQQASLAAFLAAGGTLDDLCADHGPGRHLPAHGADSCDACRLIGAALLPPAPAVPVLLSWSLGQATLPAASGTIPARPFNPAAPRAPPALS